MNRGYGELYFTVNATALMAAGQARERELIKIITQWPLAARAPILEYKAAEQAREREHKPADKAKAVLIARVKNAYNVVIFNTRIADLRATCWR